jgi:transcriptional regulator with XRE-family HTH domain
MLYERIRELREKKGVLQAEVSKRLNVTRESYSMYETGKRQMNYETLCLLADYFEVSTDYLLGRQEALPSFLSERERGIIERYRALEEPARDNVENVLNFEYSRAPKERSARQQGEGEG